MNCVRCGQELADSGKGRPPIYCGSTCRRAAEHEIRRLNRAIEKLEQEEQSYRRVFDDVSDLYLEKSQARKRHRWVLAEIERKEQRVRQLVGGGE